MVVVIMGMSVVAAGTMLMGVVLFMVRLMMVSVVVLAPRTMFVMRLLGLVLMPLVAVVAVLAMLMRVVVLAATGEEEGRPDSSHGEGGSARNPESLAGKDSHEADGGSQHYLTNNNCDQLPTLSLVLSKTAIRIMKETLGRDRDWKNTHIIM